MTSIYWVAFSFTPEKSWGKPTGSSSRPGITLSSFVGGEGRSGDSVRSNLSCEGAGIVRGEEEPKGLV